MNRTSLLVLKTSCDFSGFGNESEPLPFWGETPDQTDRTIPMTELLSKAPLLCDVVILPSFDNHDEVHLTETESGNENDDFRMSQDPTMHVVSFPSQTLLPCGIDNLLQWSSSSTDSYLLSVSNCMMEVSQGEMDSASASSFRFHIPLLSTDSYQSVNTVESSVDLHISEATQELFLPRQSSLDEVWKNELSPSKSRQIPEDNESSKRSVHISDEFVPDEFPPDPSSEKKPNDFKQVNPASSDSLWLSTCFESQLSNDEYKLTTALMEQNEKLLRSLDWLYSLGEHVSHVDASTRNEKLEFLEKRLEEELASIQMIFQFALILPVVALIVACLWTAWECRHTRPSDKSPSRKRRTMSRPRDMVDVNKNLAKAMDKPMPSIAVYSGITRTDTSVAKESEEHPRHPHTKDCDPCIRPSLSRTKNTFNLVETGKHSNEGQSQSSEEPTLQARTPQPMSPGTQLLTQFERKHPKMNTTRILDQQDDSTIGLQKSRKNRLQPPIPITPDTTSRESRLPTSSSLSSSNSLESGFFFSGPPSEIQTIPIRQDMNPRLAINDRIQPMPSSRIPTGTFVDDYW